jgi:signal transduction histidine kinase
LITGTGAYLESIAFIPHHHISGWIDFELYQHKLYMIVYFIIFSISLFLSVYLTNSIARDLYTRERELMKALNELKEAEKTKSRYVMTVVHDLKTPIAAATTYLNMILGKAMGEVNEELLRPLERSKYRLDQAIGAINDILQISKIKIGAVPEELVDVDIYDLFQEIYSETKVLFDSKNQNFNLKLNSSEKIIVQAEPPLLKLALSNLISNAYKYTRVNGRVDVNINREGIYAKISVADNGIGIPLEQHDKIFEEFYRTPLSKKEGIEGTGLGMSLVKQIIEKYRASISIQSPSSLAKDDDNPGTEFIVMFPLFYIEV